MDKPTEIEDPTCDPNNPKKLIFCPIIHAKQVIEPYILKTPCLHSKMSEKVGINMYLKCEFMQFTGSFKERGARYALSQLPDEQKKKGAVAASAGNHAQAVCYHGKQLGMPVTVVMPETAPIMKIQKCKDFGANVVVKGKDLAEAKKLALQIAKENGAFYLNGYDNPNVLAGQGTAGIEILEQCPDVDVIIVPVGGGSLLSGILVAMKKLKPCTKIIGVESESCTGFANGLANGRPILTPVKPTLADGLAVPTVGYNSVKTVLSYGVDRMISVTEQDIALSILRLLENEKVIVEGAGAAALAAVLSGQLDEFKGKNMVLLLTGGNIDTPILGRCLDQGLAADGRLVKMYVTITDRPKSTTELYRLVASLGVCVKEVQFKRTWVTSDVFSVCVKLHCETRNYDHALELQKLLKMHYKHVDLVHHQFPASSEAKKRRD